MLQNVCIYQKLENTSLILQALYNLNGNAPLCLCVLQQPITSSDNDGRCWSNLCEIWKVSQLFSELYHLDDANLKKEMTWYPWKMLPRENGKAWKNHEDG